MSEIKNTSIIHYWIMSNFPVIGNGINLIRYNEIKAESEITEYGQLVKREVFSNENDKDSKIEQEIASHFINISLIDDLSFKYFIKMISLAKQNDINIIFVRYPLPSQYLEELKTKGIFIDEFDNTVLREIEKNIENDPVVLDYRNYFANNLDYFSDTNHLNYEGSKELSKKIFEDLSK